MDDCGAFSTNALWRPSIFTVDPDADDSIFKGLRLDALSSLAPKEPKCNLFDELSGDFELPPLDLAPLETEVEQTLSRDLQAAPFLDQHGDETLDEHDVWNFDDAEPLSSPVGPRLHTWEAFQLKEDRPPHPAYFSEAGDGAFNAVFQHRERSAGVIQHDVTLRACCSLVLGRSSVLFQWNPAKRSFVSTLQRVSLPGMSLLGSQELLQQFLDTGTTFRELCAFVALPNTRVCTAMVALRRSTSAVLDHLEHHLCEQIVGVRSLLQLQQVVDRPLSILRHLHTFLGRLRRDLIDEELISTLSDEVTRLAESGSTLTGMMSEILSGASMPWLQRMAEDVGLSASMRGSNCAPSTDGIASTASDPMPEASFLAIEDTRTLSSVRRSIRLLRQHVPDHPLVDPQSAALGLDVIQTAPGRDLAVMLQRADEYKSQMTEEMTRHRHSIRWLRKPAQLPPSKDSSSTVDSEGPFALSALEDIAVLENEMGVADPTETTVYHSLQKAVEVTLESSTEQPDNISVGDFSDVLFPLRPFIDAQASLVNGAVAEYLFNKYKLLDHLELHRSYHLFGNGDFVTRLATALFSDDVQTAERKRGNIPTSETMGLRLGSRESQRWPPASSELRLTLLNVLSDSYVSSDAHQQGTTQLPGGLSFAIRELTDAEIDRVMDPTSIYALDFLRLQYTPPSPLADIFTPTIVQHYDSIFRTLLVHVRVLHATSQLSALCNKTKIRQSSRTASRETLTLRRFAWKARHFSTTIFSHFTDTVIASSWKDFSSQMIALRPKAQDEAEETQTQQPTDLPSLTASHESYLSSIRNRLFLRHKHAAIRLAVEELAGIIVKTTAAALRPSESERVSLAGQEERFNVLSEELNGLLRGLASKPAREQRDWQQQQQSSSSSSESEAAKLLLARLSWRGSESEGGKS
jgi:hypothetical protein